MSDKSRLEQNNINLENITDVANSCVNAFNNLPTGSNLTASTSDILYGKTAYVDGHIITGNVNIVDTNISVVERTSEVVPPMDVYYNTLTINVDDANLVPENIVQGVTILGVEGSASGGGIFNFEVYPNQQTAQYMMQDNSMPRVVGKSGVAYYEQDCMTAQRVSLNDSSAMYSKCLYLDLTSYISKDDGLGPYHYTLSDNEIELYYSNIFTISDGYIATSYQSDPTEVLVPGKDYEALKSFYLEVGRNNTQNNLHYILDIQVGYSPTSSYGYELYKAEVKASYDEYDTEAGQLVNVIKVIAKADKLDTDGLYSLLWLPFKFKVASGYRDTWQNLWVVDFMTQFYNNRLVIAGIEEDEQSPNFRKSGTNVILNFRGSFNQLPYFYVYQVGLQILQKVVYIMYIEFLN